MFTGGSFRKGCEFLLVSLGGFGVGFRGGGGWWFSVENERWEGGGWGRDRQRNRQVNAQALLKLPLSNLPFSFSPKTQRMVPKCHEAPR